MLKFKAYGKRIEAYGKKLKSLNENGNSKKVCSRFEDCEKVPVSD